MGFNKDIQLELKFDRILKAILGNFFITKNLEMDVKQATDFLIYNINPFKVGVRLRRYEYFLKYPNDFTIRYSRPSGIDTEIHKIRQNLVDYILYGFVNEPETKIIKYFIGDLKIFRDNEPKPIAIKTNKPPDSKLAVYNLEQFPKEFILKNWEKINDKNNQPAFEFYP